MKTILLLTASFFLFSCNTAKEKNDETIMAEFVEINNNEMKAIDYQPTYEENYQEIDHSLFDQVLKKYVSKGGRVNYAGLKKNPANLKSYIKTLEAANPDKSWSRNALLAYYMNAYNAMTLDLIINNYPTESIKDIKNPWEQKNWSINGKPISLEEIEHDILRKMNEPRIHFGINCASFSCPQLPNEAFTAQKVDQQLEKLAIQFINDSSRNQITKDRVDVSKIFRWFSEDFTKNGDLIDFLNKYSTLKINKDARVRYMDYNWELNE